MSHSSVRATRGKAVRAEPIVALYEQDRIHHVGYFAELESEMTTWEPMESSWSSYRLDALVWALTELGLAEARQVKAVRRNRFGRIRHGRSAHGPGAKKAAREARRQQQLQARQQLREQRLMAAQKQAQLESETECLTRSHSATPRSVRPERWSWGSISNVPGGNGLLTDFAGTREFAAWYKDQPMEKIRVSASGATFD